MPYQTLKLEKRGTIALLMLHRPEEGNGVDPETAREGREVCRLLSQDPGVKAVVVTGSGEAFCAGPFPPHGLLAGPESAAASEDRLAQLRLAGAIAALEQPVVAAINGPAQGQGVEVALACDLRIASETATFTLPHLACGLLPWDGGSQRLPRLIGRARALELLLTGRTVAAQEAFTMGLVHQVVPQRQVLEKALELAGRMAEHAPIAARYVKEAIGKGMDMPLDQALRLEADLNIILHSTHDRAEGIRSFLERRPPRFLGQ